MAEKLRLFIVEDDDDVAFLMRKSLERAGHEATVCHQGADALIVLGHSQFDLVLLDQQLPDILGIDLLHRLTREGINVPVLMITGVGTEDLAAQVLRAGALDYIVKDRPLTFLADLPKRVQESVTRHRLQQTNRLLIEALESARDGVCITDVQGVILHVNRALEAMFGYDRSELAGKSPKTFNSGHHSREFFSEMWRTVLNRGSWQGEVVNRRKDGTMRETSLGISPIVDAGGQLTHFVAIYRDLSEYKKIERQLFQAQKMQSVGTLAGGVAHEFNNLLAGIQGYASLGLREPNLSPDVREFFDLIVQLSERAANLTRQLLAFARKPALSRKSTSMAKLLESTAQLVQRSLNIEVDLEIEPMAAGEHAQADGNQLQQVLVNLALNARDSMPRPALRPIVFRLRRLPLAGSKPAFPQNIPPGDYLVLEVQDSGSGMPPDVLAQAFDPFFTTKEVGQGTGLGLAVAFGIVSGHQGYLSLDSELGRGTTVRIYLPRLTAGGETGSVPEILLIEPERVPGRDILVIDDEQSVLDVIRRFLEIAGHRVTAATNAAEAMELVRTGYKPDIAILDLMIPREDGAANVRRLRDAWPEIRILLCTGLVQEDQAAPLLQGETAQLLRKPFRMNELWHAVESAMSNE
jgi:two-component system cell cycle sensor histidine kinase/response regulator CckA